MNLELMEMMNQNYISRKYDTKGRYESNLGSIQTKIMQIFSKEARSYEEIDHFESQLYGNSRLFGKNAFMYTKMDRLVYPIWNQIKENMLVKTNEDELSKGFSL